jgi:hypothetical protein
MVHDDAVHRVALRAPWYADIRSKVDRFDPTLGSRPVLQKYDDDDFVDRLLADPTDSLPFDPVDDVWSYPVPLPEKHSGEGRLKFSTHRTICTGMRKLYQPSHDRFYLIVVELFCDAPGLPRLSLDEDVAVSLVIRRRRTLFGVTTLQLRQEARKLITHLLAAQHHGAVPGSINELTDVDQVMRADIDAGRFSAAKGFVKGIHEEAWMVGPGGNARWRRVEADGTAPRRPIDPTKPDGPELHEEELPMWRLPAPEGSCEEARTRSLWFGVVPTGSADHADVLEDPGPPRRTDKGAPKLDESSIYQLRCIARRTRSGHEHCPPIESLSEPTEPFRLAPFFDPDGTKNHSVSISMPDLRALAARAGQPSGTGGAKITSPPGSQFTFPSNGTTVPAGGSGTVGGNSPKICTFAIELFMIVAFFLFSLFLPIVMLIFQLWWLLALRFCLPPALQALALLETYFQPGNTVAGLPLAPATTPLTGPVPLPTSADSSVLDLVLGMPGATKNLSEPANKFPQADSEHFLAVIDPRTAKPAKPLAPLNHEDDPLCSP